MGRTAQVQAPAGTPAQNDSLSELSQTAMRGTATCRQMPPFAVTVRWTYNRVNNPATTADRSGERLGPINPGHAAFRETA
jgi:hypothetical protein